MMGAALATKPVEGRYRLANLLMVMEWGVPAATASLPTLVNTMEEELPDHTTPLSAALKALRLLSAPSDT